MKKQEKLFQAHVSRKPTQLQNLEKNQQNEHTPGIATQKSATLIEN